MKRKSYLCVLCLVMSLLMVFTACSSGNKTSTETQTKATEAATTAATTSAAATPKTATITLKYAHAAAATNPDAVALQAMFNTVKEKTNGSLVIDMYANSELGTLADVVEQIQRGAPMITLVGSDFLANYCPDHAALNGAYLYDSYKDMRVIAESDWYAGLRKQIRDKGIEILYFGWNGGDRHIMSTKPIRTPEDLVGKKMRVSGGLMFVEMFKAFGASPITLAWNENYQALQQGIIDGVEAPLYTLYSSSLQEVAKYVTLTGHIICADVIMMSADVFNSIPENDRKIFVEEMEKTINEYNDSVAANQVEARKKLEEAGVTFIELSDEEKANFAKACKSMYEAVPTFSKGIYDTIRGIIENGK